MCDSFHQTTRGDPLLFGVLVLSLAGLPLPVAAQEHASDAPQRVTERSSSATGLLPEPRFITAGIDFAQRTIGGGDQTNNGFYPEVSNMVTGSGWISAGPGYRHWLFGDRAIVDASAAISWRSYKMAQARFELTKLARSRIAVGSQVRWQDLTQITYFGTGAESETGDRSEYRMKTVNVVGYTTVRPKKWLSIGGRIGWLRRPALLSPAGTFERGNPPAQAMFADDVVFTYPEQPNYLHGEASILADTRDHRSHPTHGGVYRAAWAAYRDRDAGVLSFRRYEAEGAQFVPLAGGRVVLALHAWVVGSNTDDGRQVPFYLMPSLGGHNTLRSYTDYRFHDRNLLVINAESRFSLMTHVDLAAFVDAGNVAPRASQLNLHKRSYGVGFRMHSDRATFARVDIARGTDGWRFLFRTSDPLRLARLSRQTATVPFAP